jgi:hypothetical protein
MSTRAHYRNLYELGRDLDRLRELAGPHIADEDDDAGQAIARIPDETQRREAGELLSRLAPIIGPHSDEINAAIPSPGDRLRSV